MFMYIWILTTSKILGKFKTLALFAQKSPHALHRVRGPAGPRRIIGVDFELVPQCVQLQ